jgi:hypothetical protein
MALLPASIAQASAETPILRLYAQWAPLRSAMLDDEATNAPDGGTFNNATSKAAEAELDRLRPLIEGTTTTTAEGIIAQIAYIEEDFAGGHSEKDGPTVEGVPVSLLRRLAVAAERLQ